MRACGLLHFNLVDCAAGALFWWVPMLPWWGWLLAVVVLVGVVWKFAGWPGLIALAAAAGFVFGRRSVSNDEVWPHPDPKLTKRKPAQKKPRKVGGRRFDADANRWVEK